MVEVTVHTILKTGGTLFLIALVLYAVLGGFTLSEQANSWPCDNTDECYRISQEKGLDKTMITCQEGPNGPTSCKVELTS